MDDVNRPKQEVFLTTKEVCGLLKISKTMLYNLRATGEFSVVPYRIGNKVLWKQEEVLQWMETQRCHA